jgi:hypothetical protein
LISLLSSCDVLLQDHKNKIISNSYSRKNGTSFKGYCTEEKVIRVGLICLNT